MIVGSRQVGKSSLINTYCKERFNEDEENGIVLPEISKVKIVGKKFVPFTMVDTGFDDQFRIQKYKDAALVIIAAAVNDPSSL